MSRTRTKLAALIVAGVLLAASAVAITTTAASAADGGPWVTTVTVTDTQCAHGRHANDGQATIQITDGRQAGAPSVAYDFLVDSVPGPGTPLNLTGGETRTITLTGLALGPHDFQVNYTVPSGERWDAFAGTGIYECQVEIPDPTVSFLDVPDSHPFAKEIGWMAGRGITTGYDVPGGKEFRPYGTVGRDAMAAFLYRYAEQPDFYAPAGLIVPADFTAPSVSPFTDVPTSHPFYKQIAWLAANGVSTGWDVGGGKKEFRPSQPIARDAMAAFLYRFDRIRDFYVPSVPSFTDVPTSHPFYKEIEWLAWAGVSTGWDVGGKKREFRPSLNITRDAMAAFLLRYYVWLY